MSTSPETTSRREFVRNTCSAFAVLSLTSGSVIFASCDSGGSSGEKSLPDGVSREGNTLSIDLTEFPTLREVNTSLWISAVDVIVIHGVQVGYRAFRSICPHEGQEVDIFEPANGGFQLRCPAHNWTFDVDGDPTGRAEAGLTRFPVSLEGQTLRVILDQ